ncbi:MAG TPA: hypothetical protein VIQ26_00035 [Microbacteriaceae bacterium]|jgi:hypothetical protein
MSTDDDENDGAETQGGGEGEDPETEGDTASGGAPEPPDEP